MARRRWPIGEVVRWKKGEIHPYLAELPHWRKVPKDPEKHLLFRRDLLKKCAASVSWRNRVWEMCAEDPVFWVNAFCWLTEPRIGESVSGRSPFITWRHQDPVLAAGFKYFGIRHMAGPKSRMQGASWLACAENVHAFTFRKNVILGLGSKNMDYADDPDNPGSLGWKVDYLLDSMPLWMRPQHDRKISNHSWTTPKKGSGNVIIAEASTDGIGRANRFTRHTLDESAFYPNKNGGAAMAVQNLVLVTNQIVMPSTPNGDSGEGGEFYLRATQDSTWLRYVLSWQDNPVHAAGMYTTDDNGHVKILDPSYEFPHDYEFILDGRTRSPWYDMMWYDMRCSAIDVARELDMDFGGSKPKPFAEGLINESRRTTRDPDRIGDLRYEKADLQNLNYMTFTPNERGKLKLWCPLDLNELPPPGDYTIGCDPAAGTGGESANNACICVFNDYGEQVAEFAANTVSPVDLAQLCYALCYWFGRGEPKPFLIWDKVGPVGSQFTEELVRLKYPRVYWDKDPKGAKHERPGYHTNKTHELLGALVSALHNRQVSLRSELCVTECGQYEWDASGRTWIHPSSRDTIDPSATGLSHGDRVVAAALGVVAMNHRNILKEAAAKAQGEPHPREIEGTLEWHIENRKRKNRLRGLAQCRW